MFYMHKSIQVIFKIIGKKDKKGMYEQRVKLKRTRMTTNIKGKRKKRTLTPKKRQERSALLSQKSTESIERYNDVTIFCSISKINMFIMILDFL